MPNGGTPLKEIFARFGIDFDDKELQKANSSLEGITRSLRDFGAVIAGAAVVQGIRNFVTETVRMGDEVGKTAIQLGISTQELQAWSHAAQLGGADAEQFSNGLAALQEKAFDAAVNGGEAAKTFRDLGLEIKGANDEVLGAGDLLRGLADRLQETENPTERVAIAMRLMGEDGRRLLPMLAQGSEGLAEAAEQFDRLGGFSQEAVEASADMSDAMLNFRTVATSVRSRLAVVIFPILEGFLTHITDLTVAFREMTEESHFLEVGITTLASVMVAAGARVLVAWLPQIAFFGLLAAALLLVVLAVDDLITAFRGGDSVLSSIFDELMAHLGMWQRFTDVVNEARAALTLFQDTWNVVGGFVRGLVGAERTDEETAASQFTGGERATTGAGAAIRRLVTGAEEPGAQRIEQIQRNQQRVRANRTIELARTGAEALEGEIRTGEPIIGPGGQILGRQPTQVMEGGQWVNVGETNVTVNVQASGVDENEVAQRVSDRVGEATQRSRRETLAALGVSETS